MRLLKVVIVLLLALTLILSLRTGRDFPLPQVLPLCDGQPLSLEYAAGGIAILCLLAWGLRRLPRGEEDDSDR